MNAIVGFNYPQNNIKSRNIDAHEKVMVFKMLLYRMSMIFMFKSIYFSKELFSVTLEQEKKITTFKTHDTQVHIQIIYCQLTGCCPVAIELNYQLYNIKSEGVPCVQQCFWQCLPKYVTDLNVQMIRTYCQTFTVHR